MTMIARSYERRIRTGGVTRTGQTRHQHHGHDERHLIAERTQGGARTVSRDAAMMKRMQEKSPSAAKISGHFVTSSPWTLTRRLGWKPGVESRLCPHLLALGRAEGVREPALGSVITINKYSNLKKKFITDLGIKIMDPFAKTLRGSIPGGAVYRHLASNQRSANKKQVKEQLHSRKQTEHVKKLKT